MTEVKFQVLAGLAPEVNLTGFDRNLLIQIAVIAIDALLRKKH